ncbi:E3 ubiquitin-protein ligase TRIM35 [Drosophila obscura]|uniref:E3 ubiquitin-protein ligase TRIM35 n=1 Tax=Drosophila obscura TaxID=7282 RepID=UPI000BA14317|nr:E3 ubiquitin-protein ligase TRIM35 [Drosophila obscura]
MQPSREECAVCLDRMRNQVHTPCKHSFCRRCLRRVYYESPSKTCPLCRAPIDYYLRKYRTSIKVFFFS